MPDPAPTPHPAITGPVALAPSSSRVPHPAQGEDLVEILHRRGQRATPQRLVILRELRRRARHCTADELRAGIRGELPGTSTPTVYATLELLVELGLARRIAAGGPAVLYDARVEPHQHVVCRRCGEVDDLDVTLDDSPLLGAARAAGFVPDSAELVISGLCSGCAAAQNQESQEVRASARER